MRAWLANRQTHSRNRSDSRIAKRRPNRLGLWQMPTVAEQLRRAREGQKLNIYQIADLTKIKTDQIRALESGTYDSFAAPVYIRGFVRTYAKVLKLDEARLSADLDEELAQTEKFREPPPLGDRPRSAIDYLMLQFSKVNWRVVGPSLAVALLVLLTAYGIRTWMQKKNEDPLKGLGPGLYQPKSETSGELLPLPAPTPAPAAAPARRP